MTKQIPTYLKLVTDTTETPADAGADLAALAGMCRTFEQATGWRLEYTDQKESFGKSNLMWSAPVNPGVGASPGHIRLFSSEVAPDGAPPRIPLERATPLAAACGNLWGELLGTRRALAQREAELAGGAPLSVRTTGERSSSLSDQLEAVLRGGAEAMGCHAAGLYLLDDATSELKLRAAWGLARKRLMLPARPLRGALADLEALLGHAVVISDDKLHAYWQVPEDGFGSCVCVPVSSASMPLGTLWAFCREPRDFTAAQTNLWEVVAGRVAADLERQVLVDEAISARGQVRQIETAERLQQEQLPHVAPQVDGWEIAATVDHGGRLGGTFYDWFALEGGNLAVLAGAALQSGASGALTASTLRGAARAFDAHEEPTKQFLTRANSILWTGSAGNASAGLFHAVVEPRAEALTYSTAGPLRVLSVRPSSSRAIAGPTSPLGSQEDLAVDAVRRPMAEGELLLIYASSHLANATPEALTALDKRLALSLKPFWGRPLSQLVKVVADAAGRDSSLKRTDRTILAIRRRHR